MSAITEELPYVVPCSEREAWAMRAHLGEVNARDMAGFRPGRAMLQTVEVRSGRGFLTFAVRDRAWNAGNGVYPHHDFTEVACP